MRDLCIPRQAAGLECVWPNKQMTMLPLMASTSGKGQSSPEPFHTDTVCYD